MKLKRIVSLFFVALFILCFSASVFATDPATQPQTTTPQLGSGAVVTGYSVNTGSVYQGNVISVTAHCYIPIENYAGVFIPDGLITSATFEKNASFSSSSPITAVPFNLTQTDAFVTFSVTFSGIQYLGKGNTFNFKLNYRSGDTGISVPLSIAVVECVETVENKQEEITVSPVFALASSEIYSISAGEEGSFNVPLTNLTSFYPALVTVEAASASDKLTVMNTSVQRFGGYSSYGGLAYTTFSVSPTVKVYTDTTTPAGRYPVTLTVNSYDVYGNSKKTDTLTMYINVTNSIRTDKVYISGCSVSKQSVKSGDIFNVSVNVTNNSGVDLTSAKLTLEGLDGSHFAMNSGIPTIPFTLKNNKTGQITFTLVGCDGIASVREVIPAKLEYYLDPDKTDTLQTLTQNVTIPCTPDKSKTDEKDEDEIFAPNIIIKQYDFGGDHVLGGKQFTLSLTAENTSSTATIRNLKITVQGAAGSGENGIAFSPANSSNSFFIENLGPKQSTDIVIDMLAKADSKPDSYPITVTFEFEYTKGKKNAKADEIVEKISIPLQQEDRFDISNSDIQSEGGVNEEAYVNLTMLNKGKSSVYNVSVRIEGDGFTTDSDEYYIGNIDSGSEEYFDAKIIPQEEGEVKGTVIISYEDANGSSKEKTVPFTMNAYDYSEKYEELEMPIEDVGGEVEPTGGFNILFVIIPVVVVIAVVVVIIVIVKKRKKRKLEEEDDEDN